MFDIGQVFQWKGNFPAVAMEALPYLKGVEGAKHCLAHGGTGAFRLKAELLLMVLAVGMVAMAGEGGCVWRGIMDTVMTVWMDD
jgi:hypothetical protein